MITAALVAFMSVSGGTIAIKRRVDSSPAVQGTDLAQAGIERRPAIRVSPAASLNTSVPKVRDWKERDAPKCYVSSTLSKVFVSKLDSIDIVLRNGEFIRARLKKGCNSLDFYSGFYIKPTKDGRLCEDRDFVHSRAGDECQIAKFKTLERPKPKRKGKIWPWDK
jgi:hypothetical protein